VIGDLGDEPVEQVEPDTETPGEGEEPDSIPDEAVEDTPEADDSTITGETPISDNLTDTLVEDD